MLCGDIRASDCTTGARIACSNRLHKRAGPQRCTRDSAVLFAQPARFSPQGASFSPNQSQKALQYQLEKPAPQQAAEAAQPSPDLTSYEQDLRRRQTKAREWITPWLTTKARARSLDTLAALRENTAGLTSDQQDTALKRLLGQSWQVAAAHPVAYDSDDETSSLDEDNSRNGCADRAAPPSSWEVNILSLEGSIDEDML